VASIDACFLIGPDAGRIPTFTRSVAIKHMENERRASVIGKVPSAESLRPVNGKTSGAALAVGN